VKFRRTGKTYLPVCCPCYWRKFAEFLQKICVFLCFSRLFLVFFCVFPANSKNGLICMEWRFLAKCCLCGSRNLVQLFPTFARVSAVVFQEIPTLQGQYYPGLSRRYREFSAA
jgi:hypothetical protein